MSEPASVVLPVGDFALESGEVLRGLRLAYAVAGPAAALREEAVLVIHSLTGRHTDLAGWWPNVVGPGAAIDTRRTPVICVNLPGSCYGSSFDRRRSPAPAIDTRDMARAIALVLDHLGVESLALVTGGSLGGMVALELLATFPRLARAAAVFAAPAAHTAWGIGWNHLQRELVSRHGAEGLALARQAGMLTYRSPRSLGQRFGRAPDGAHGFSMRSWLAHHGEKLAARFDAASYLTLLDTMDAHDVARGRGSLAAAFAQTSAEITGIGIEGDALYPEEDVLAWVPAARAGYRRLASSQGHDAFLLETGRVGQLLRDALAAGTREPHGTREAHGVTSG